MIEHAHESGLNQLVGCVENLQSVLKGNCSTHERLQVLNEVIRTLSDLEMHELDNNELQALAQLALIDRPKLKDALTNLIKDAETEQSILEIRLMQLEETFTVKLAEALAHLTKTPVPTVGLGIEQTREQVEQVGL